MILFFLLSLTCCTSVDSTSPVAASSVRNTPYFIWPVKRGTLTQRFKSYSKKHDGIDISAGKNTPIYAAEAGVIIYAGKDFNGYGNLIVIEHAGSAWASFYGHLNKFHVSEGERVRQGELIAAMGNTGRSSGVHLHFEIRKNLKPVDPLDYLSKQSILSQR